MQKIFVVDDSPMILQMVKDRVEEFGFYCQTSPSGGEARKVLEKDPNFLLIICDIEMADGDGLELCQYISENIPRLPIILFSGIVPKRIPIVDGRPVPLVDKLNLFLLEAYIKSISATSRKSLVRKL